jgi:hypothetical protein
LLSFGTGGLSSETRVADRLENVRPDGTPGSRYLHIG